MSTALEQALAAEHAAVFAYGVVGGVLGGDLEPPDPEALAGLAVHRARRDRLVAMLHGDGPAAEPLYALPFAVRDARDARRLAAEVERRCASVYAFVVASSTGAERAFAARALSDAAVRELTWGGEPSAFPGLGSR